MATEPAPHAEPELEPGATVVIAARNAEDLIAAAVGRLEDQRDAAGRPVRVIVVDDASSDATAARAAEAGADVIANHGAGEPPFGPARARNVGVAAATSELIVFTDADCAPAPGFVAAMTAPFADPEVVATKGAYLSEQREWVARFVQLEYEERYARTAAQPRIDFVDTYAAAYRNAVFRRVGGFDERYRKPSTEDQELGFRVHATGGAMLFVPEARVVHRHAASLWGYARKKAKIGYYKVATMRAHPGKAVKDSHTPGSLKLQLLLGPLSLLGLMLAAILAVVPVPGAPPWLPLLGLLPALAFLLTALPLIARALRADPVVGLVSPLLIGVRANALAVGVAAGIIGELRGGILPRGEPVSPWMGHAAKSSGVSEAAR